MKEISQVNRRYSWNELEIKLVNGGTSPYLSTSFSKDNGIDIWNEHHTKVS